MYDEVVARGVVEVAELYHFTDPEPIADNVAVCPWQITTSFTDGEFVEGTIIKFNVVVIPLDTVTDCVCEA